MSEPGIDPGAVVTIYNGIEVVSRVETPGVFGGTTNEWMRPIAEAHWTRSIAERPGQGFWVN